MTEASPLERESRLRSARRKTISRRSQRSAGARCRVHPTSPMGVLQAITQTDDVNDVSATAFVSRPASATGR